MNWKVPLLHIRICYWLENCSDLIRVLMVFRGASKSTIFAIYKAWLLYKDRTWVNLIWAADGKLATKLTRDTINVLRRHPLCGGMLPKKPGAQMFWVTGAVDARNASMTAVGVDQNVTSARAVEIDYDDIEVPKNIKTAEARENLRQKIQEATFILVPGGRETYIGTPHTHDSIYKELEEGGAAVLKIPLFENAVRYENTAVLKRYRFNFKPGHDGLYVFAGIGKAARLFVEGRDYKIEGNEVVFPEPPVSVIDIYANCTWPERFTRSDLEKRRKKTRTLNAWDSQYQLQSKPVTESRLDPTRMTEYNIEPEIRYSNGITGLYLGTVQIVSAGAHWDPSGGKLNSDDSVFSVTFFDGVGRRYWHRAIGLEGDIAIYADDAKTIIDGQVHQICEAVKKFHLRRITVETNGIGGFAPAILRAALKQRKIVGVAVKEIHTTENKNKVILETFEPLLSVKDQLWAHTSILDGPSFDQMREWNAAKQNQDDDYLDAGAGSMREQPERVGKLVGNPTTDEPEDWRPDAGTHEVEFELS